MNRKSRRRKAAIVGLGRIASLFASDKKRKGISTHAQAYLGNKRTALAAACDLDHPRLEEFGKAWGVKALYSDFDEMLRIEKPELLSICTWNNSHRFLFESAVKAGVKGVICEKPIADSLEAADAMTALSRESGVPLLVNYARRYVRLYRDVKTAIEGGKLGSIQAVSCYYTAGVLNTGTHLFDFLRFFFGEVAWVWADPNTKIGGDADPTLSGYLYFKSGFGCTLTALDVSSYLMFEADIYGSKRRLRVTNSGADAETWDAAPHPLFSGYKALKSSGRMRGDLGEALPSLVKNLVECVEGKARPISSAADATASLEIAVALRASHREGGRRIDLPLRERAEKLSSK